MRAMWRVVHPYLPLRYMGEEGFCCMGEDHETHLLAVESLEGGRCPSREENQDQRLGGQR